ncbi:hypothetical protein AB6A40_011549 [Gnathostoma spinigerum]|uniref:Uncharacterized protein n=1 Tax=Gnathostoma spinigerum TaxID=75299 RepID=A0ABD6F4S8_9BILA
MRSHPTQQLLITITAMIIPAIYTSIGRKAVKFVIWLSFVAFNVLSVWTLLGVMSKKFNREITRLCVVETGVVPSTFLLSDLPYSQWNNDIMAERCR